MRSAGNVFLGAVDDLDLEFRADELRLAAGDAERNAASVLVLDHAHGREPAADGDAFGLRLLDLVLVRLHLVDIEYRRQRDLGAVFRRHRRCVVGEMPGDRELGEIRRLGMPDVAQAPRDRRDVDRRVTAADDDDVLADVAQPAVVEGLEERGGGDDVRRVAAGGRQRAP